MDINKLKIEELDLVWHNFDMKYYFETQVLKILKAFVSAKTFIYCFIPKA